MTAPPLVIVAGNPNTGKTTLYNRLTGARQKVGNYPGITVDRHEGRATLPGGTPVRLADVPGCYSLSARSAEEQVALQAVCGLPPNEAPAAVIVVVDSTQLLRNLYLVLQLLETHVPVVVALNMIDRLEASGQRVDARALERALGVPVVPVSASKGEGVAELERVLEGVLADPSRALPGPRWVTEDGVLQADVDAVADALPASWRPDQADRRQALALWAILSIDEQDELEGVPDELRRRVLARRRLATAAGRDLDQEIVAGRYQWIDAYAATFLHCTGPACSTSEKVDTVLLHPLWGFVIFLGLMFLVFQSLFSWSAPAISLIERTFDLLGGQAERLLGKGIAGDFVTHGLIAGVGSVLVFLPQILLLFLFVAIMEDSGYLARVAFLMDRIMRLLGLHGRAFVPMLSGFACAVPAILATRTMERRRDRLLTMMVVPLMTCSARLPVYTLVIAALFPARKVLGFLPLQGLLMAGLYVFGTLAALTCAGVLSRTVLRGPRVPLILELPPYRWPHPGGVLRVMWEKSRVFLLEAGTVILACTIVLWFLLSFPRQAPGAAEFEARRMAAGNDSELVAQIDHEEAGALLRASYGGRLGRAIEPVLEPLGFDWKIGIGLLGSFAAREVFIATMGVVYGVGSDVDEGSVTLRERIHRETRANGQPLYTPLVGLSLLIFFALAAQCMSTLAAVKRETAGWRWPLFLFGYMTSLAWIASFAIYQGGRLLGFS